MGIPFKGMENRMEDSHIDNFHIFKHNHDIGEATILKTDMMMASNHILLGGISRYTRKKLKTLKTTLKWINFCELPLVVYSSLDTLLLPNLGVGYLKF